MEKVNKIRTKLWDIFQIPLDENKIAYGQVIEKSQILRVIVFNKSYNIQESPSLNEILEEPVLILTDTMDAKLYFGHWIVYGNKKNDMKSFPKPKFKVGQDKIYITDYSNRFKRIATKEEANQLDYQFSVSPIRVQNAVQAYFGFQKWDEEYNKLTYEYCLEKSKFEI